MYEIKSTVKFSEADISGRLTIPALIDYLQDTSTAHSIDVGLGYQFEKARNRAWFLGYMQINIARLPKIEEHITVRTQPYAMKGVMGLRSFDVLDADGEQCVCVNAVYAYVDSSTGMPAKIGDEEGELFGLGDAFPMENEPRKIKIADKLTKLEPYAVKWYDCDANGHVNNGSYVRIAHELINHRECDRVRVEFKKAAKYEDVMIPFFAEFDDRMQVVLRSETDVYAVVEFRIGGLNG